MEEFFKFIWTMSKTIFITRLIFTDINLINNFNQIQVAILYKLSNNKYNAIIIDDNCCVNIYFVLF